MAEEVKQMSLAGILGDEKPQVEEKPKTEAKTEVKKEITPDVKSEVKTEVKETKPEVKQEVKPEVKHERPQETDSEKAFKAAAIDERRKRQELEKRLADLEAKNKAAEPKKEFWEDPTDAFNKFREEMNQEKQALRNEGVNMRLATTEMLAKSRYKDYDESIKEWGGILEQTPEAQRPILISQWLGSQDPAEFAYQAGKNSKLLREAGSVDSLRARIEKETRLKIESELKEKEEALKKERESIPGTLSDTKGVTQGKVEWSGPTALDDVLKG